MPTLLRVLRALPLMLISPVLMTVSVLAMALTDLAFAIFGRTRADATGPVSRRAASVVIPNWNGRKFLERCLGALRRQTASDLEVLLVDNASSDDYDVRVQHAVVPIKGVGLHLVRGAGR